jgi:anti-anti-sigma factor
MSPTQELKQFAIRVRGDRDACRLDIVGELDLAVADQLEGALRFAGDARLLLIDLAGCDFFAPAEVGVLVASDREHRARGSRLAMFAAVGQPLRLLTQLGLAREGLLFATESDAIGAGGLGTDGPLAVAPAA